MKLLLDSRFRGNDTAARLVLPLHFPCRRAVLVVLECDAHRGELIADAVGFFPVFCGAGGETEVDSSTYNVLVDTSYSHVSPFMSPHIQQPELHSRGF